MKVLKVGTKEYEFDYTALLWRNVKTDSWQADNPALDALWEARELLSAAACALDCASFPSACNLINAFLIKTAARATEQPKPDDAPVQPEGYELLPKGDGHVVQPDEKCSGPASSIWLLSGRVGETADPWSWYCRPKPAESKPLPRAKGIPDGTVVMVDKITGLKPLWIDIIQQQTEVINALVDAVEALRRQP